MPALPPHRGLNLPPGQPDPRILLAADTAVYMVYHAIAVFRPLRLPYRFPQSGAGRGWQRVPALAARDARRQRARGAAGARP